MVLTTVLADASNLGLTGMAKAFSVATYKQLVWTAGWHLREETYGRALARIVAEQQSDPLATAFGEATISSSDGQHFPLGGRGESTGAVNPHKGSGPAISFYTHIPGRYAPYPRQNGLALALREVGRIERTLFMLDRLEDPALRRQATAELNKGESRNALARAVCFHRLGRVRDRTRETQQHRASGLNLVVAAIILWNTVYLGLAVETLRRQGEIIPDNLPGHLAPLGWQHVNLTGDHLWAATASPGPAEFRELRTVIEGLAA